MSDLSIIHPSLLPLVPRMPVAVRVATLADLPFVDGLQKKQTKQVGFFPTKAIEVKIALEQVIVAEAGMDSGRWVVGSKSGESSSLPTAHYPPSTSPIPVGYLIGQDQYFKRDDVGVIYQINVVPEYRRSLVAATLLKAQFERSAYGCKLYCCWCAQDVEANRFWEAMGFSPLAFRTGSEKKSRTHIFWQKRIRQGDTTTPWWFPSKTAGGTIGEDRIVLPIPPGAGWRDAMPRVLPGGEGARIENGRSTIGRGESPPLRSSARDPRLVKPPTPRKAHVPQRPEGVALGGLWMAPPVTAVAVKEKPVRQPKAAKKNDPRLVAAARELRDRWLDEVNAGRASLSSAGKYDVTRQIALEVAPAKLLAA